MASYTHCKSVPAARRQMITDDGRIEDNEKLRDKVTEAVGVFNDYVKTQGTDSSRTQQDPSSEDPVVEGESEGAKA